MVTRRLVIAPFLALLSLGLLALPAGAANGGAGPDVLILPGTPAAVVRFGNPLATASANGITIATRSTAMLRGRLHVRGNAPAQLPGGVRIERLAPRLGWIAVATATVAPDGSFDAVWRPNRSGALQLPAVAGNAPVGISPTAAAGTAAAAPQVDVTVYRPGVASWYGPGSYGATTACGVRLRRWTLGVAHRTLPCGTNVALYFRGRTLVVPVIDRGPYAVGRTWDLTPATQHGLGISDGLVTLGALALPLPSVR